MALQDVPTQGTVLAIKRETELLDEALTMIRACVYRPNVVQGRHWKVSWVNQQGRTRLLVIALFRVIAEREYSHAHCCEGCWRHERFPAGIGGKLAALIRVLSPDQDGEVIATVHAIIRLLVSSGIDIHAIAEHVKKWRWSNRCR